MFDKKSKLVVQQTFLKKYWQKAPMFLKGAFLPQEHFSKDLLFRLACEKDSISRLVTKTGDESWSVTHGPFSQKTLSRLGKRDWTLLTQEVNFRVPEAQAIMDLYNFIPSWRMDDLMVSYAVPGGSVGPHTDQYDVFLIQAWGQRKWEISEKSPFKMSEDGGLKLIRNFKSQRSFIANPGDVLYLPPGVAHYGVATEECVTLSVGFRAPSATQLVDAAFSAVMGEGPLLSDPERTPAKYFGEVTKEDFGRMSELIKHVFDGDEVKKALVDCVTTARRDAADEVMANVASTSFSKQWFKATEWRWRTSVRVAFAVINKDIYLSIDGRGFSFRRDIDKKMVRLLSSRRHIELKELASFYRDKNCKDFLESLWRQGLASFF